MTAKRVVVFLDWQNVYMRARESFHDPAADPAVKGQVDPVDLAHVLKDDHATRHEGVTFELGEIRIYRGRPTQQRDPIAHAAFRRQTAAWASNRLIRPVFSDLRYPLDWGEATCRERPREKGVDVALAVDLVTLCQDGGYDVAIVMSADYDLTPALSYVARRTATRGAPVVEVAAWRGDQDGRPLRIRLDNQRLHCIWLTEQQYWGVMDERDYNVPAERPTGPPRPGPYRPGI